MPKTKSIDCSMIHDRAVAGICILPENGKFRIYVAWEWAGKPEQGIMGFFKSNDLYSEIGQENIDDTMRIGARIEEKEYPMKIKRT